MSDYQNATTNADGKYLVPAPLATEIIKQIQNVSAVIPLLRKWPMASLTEDINMVDDEVAATWVASEGAAKTGSKGTFKRLTLTAQELAVIVPFTERILDNANVDIVSIMREQIVNAFVKKLEQTYLGYDSDGTFTEDFTDDIPADHTIAAGTGDDLLVDISNALGKIEEDGFTDNIAFVTHPAVKASLRNLRTDEGIPIYQPANGSLPETLFGYPVKFTRNFSKVGSPAKYELIVGSWNYGIEGTRQELKFGVSRDASIVIGENTYNLFQQNMVALKAYMYRAFRVADVNAFAKVSGL